MQFRRLTQLRYAVDRTVMRPTRPSPWSLHHNQHRFVQMTYQTKDHTITRPFMVSLAICYFMTFIIFASTKASADMDRWVPISIGQPRQGKYFPPHCRYITPYDEMVRAHKRKLKEQQNDE
mmetsp:Transcript_26099/g.42646  ORF Transcript_26099/g.42646 Transcript_26099/m.42646 type:complete len:121 (+) Transcript_26099:52-414(+)